MVWVTESEKAKQAKAKEIKAQLATLDEKCPRWAETLLAKDKDAMFEVIDAKGTKRQDIIKQKKDLRKQLENLS